MKIVAYCDGGSRGNPGPAGIGVTIQSPRGGVLAEISEAIGYGTNNVAEYTAVLRALERAHELGATEVEIVSDSKLLVEQLAGRYRVKNPTLQRLHAAVRAAASPFAKTTYRHVRREGNRRADALVNQALEGWLAEHPDDHHPEGPHEAPLL